MDISVVICTYNPEEAIFSKCLAAVQSLRQGNLSTEVIVVDNNSREPLVSRSYVQEFLAKLPQARVIVEREQGLAYARIAGFKDSTGDYLVFFDDDNEPQSGYITEAHRIMQSRPFLGVVGPAKIHVKYLGDVDPWIEKNLGSFFQEKNAGEEEYILSAMSWAPWYPPGTGQVIRRSVFDAYRRYFLENGSQTSDRKGDSLASAGDSQIIWSSINQKMAVGHHPALVMNHLIPARRANFSYLKRLTYHLEVSGNSAFIEMYPSRINEIPRFSTWNFCLNMLRIVFNDLKDGRLKNTPINLSTLLGRSQAYINIHKAATPGYLNTFKKLLKIS